MGVIQLGNNIFTGKSNASPPCLDLSDGTSILLTDSISGVVPRGTNIEFRKGSKVYYLTNERLTIADLFPDPILASHISSQVGKSLTEIITLEELDKVTYLGAATNGTTSGFFTGKNVSSWEGTQHLKKLKKVMLKGVLGNAREIDLNNAVELESLEHAFREVKGLEKIYLPDTLDRLKTLYYAFQNATSLTYVKMPISAEALERMDFAFVNTKLAEVSLPLKLDNLGNIVSTFTGTSGLKTVKIPAVLPALTTSLNLSGLDLVNRAIVYHSDDSVTSKAQIKYHNGDGTPQYSTAMPDYSNLKNLID